MAPPVMQVHQSAGQHQLTVSHSPFPSPEMLQAYEGIHPGSIAIIIEMTRQEQAHRQALESNGQKADIEHREALVEMQERANSRTHASDIALQVLGAGVSALCVGGAIYSVSIHADWYIVAGFLSFPVAGIVKAIRERWSVGAAPQKR